MSGAFRGDAYVLASKEASLEAGHAVSFASTYHKDWFWSDVGVQSADANS